MAQKAQSSVFLFPDMDVYKPDSNRGIHKAVRFCGDIPNILKKYKEGYHKEYDLLLHQLADIDIKPSALQNWLNELRNCVSFLSREYESLVAVVLKIEWVNLDQALVEEYQAFITSLVSAQTFYLRAVIKMLVKHFFPKIPAASDQSLEDRTNDERRIFGNAHSALEAISQIAPMTSAILPSVLSECFPYMKKETHIQECYVKNLLQLSLYFPKLRSKILELIVEKMIKMDVNAPKHELEEDEDEDDEAMDTQFDMDGIDGEEHDKDELMEKENTEDDEGGPMKHEMADRLDVMISAVFQYLYDVSHPQGKFHMECAKSLWRQLLGIFERIILPTHSSLHVQYIMFYMCSFNQNIADAFLDYLIKKLHNPNTACVVRQSTAAYISSFLSRAKFVPIQTVKATFDVLFAWIHKYIDGQDGSSRSYPDVNLHGAFYSVCQAVFYVFVFRHQQLLDSAEGLSYARSLNLDRIVMCRLNPLKVCLHTVVNMFATVTRMYQIVYCYTIIERNNRAVLPVVSHGHSSELKLSNLNPLDSYFPFDPYLLSRSKRYIKNLYQEWEGNLPEHEDNENAEDDDDEFFEYIIPNPDLNPDSQLPLGITPTGAHAMSPGFKHT
ncbi:RNA polymerase I-specific transcription initiation factor RRN3-like [Ptychodera flava]|uniref:RNA polymerase I-specific transcription initiation factor RRN3-like n=1 Tax=Ptychodera flava TaxID=63121 RepID=UPI00396A39FB